MKYIATFYSHFGAMRFKKICDQRELAARLMPVPRDLSSSCGTCVSFEANSFEANSFDEENCIREELEQVVCQSEAGYQVLYRAMDS